MSSIIELSDIEEYNAEDFADVAKIVNKDKDRDDINEDKSEDDENNGTVAFFTSKLQVPKIIYTTVPVEYPETSLEGVATIYNVTGWKNHMDAFSDGDQWHRFIKIKPEEIDISLLQNLFSGTASAIIIPRNCRCKKCDIPHLNNGTAVRGDIIEKSCLVQFIKIIPHNIAKCPFVALISYFNKDILAEVHVSLNNIDKLRYLIGKAYKNLHPFGQGVMGIYHNVLTANSNLSNYVHKIVLSFCRVFTNVFTAEGYHRLFSSLFQIIREVSGQSIQFQHIHKEGIGCILADLDNAQAKGLGLALHNLDHKRD
uniref:Uncharacterized protein n=1 Tax=Rhizophagus irregularis (strain DAOM 181602 / DAOM 197198 / MUCL 43194) TaxID=747089 RepID=U9T6F6_RHIID